MKSNVNKMTEGNTLKLLLVFALPVLIGNLFQQLYNVADSMIVGKYVGTTGLAAVGAVGSVQFLFFSFCMGLSNGIGIVVSQYFGADNHKKVKQSVFNGTILTLFLAFIISVLAILTARPCLELMQTPVEIFDQSLAYMSTVCYGIMGIAVYNTAAELLRALGDSKTPLKFLTVATLTNIALDFVFIIYFDMGVRGAGLATIVSQYLAAIGVVTYAIKNNPYCQFEKEDMVLDKDIIVKCIKTSLPVALQFSMIAVSLVVLQSVVNGFGPLIVATFTVTSKVENVISQPYATLTTALTAYSGQNIGAGKLKRVGEGLKWGLIIMTTYTAIMVPLIFFFGEEITSIFVSDPEVMKMGASALKVTSSFYIFLGLIYVTRGVLNGVGDTIFAFISGVLEMLGRVGFAKPMTLISVIGVWGLWIATGITWFMAGTAGVVRFMIGKWKKPYSSIEEDVTKSTS